MSYIQELRAIVGHRPLLVPAAGVLIRNSRGEILLQRRGDDGLWGIPGGSAEIGETMESTARREAREETGLELGVLALFGVFSGPELFHVYPNGDQVVIVSVVYTATDTQGELRTDNDETLELRYFAVAELDDLDISPPNRPILNHYRRSVI